MEKETTRELSKILENIHEDKEREEFILKYSSNKYKYFFQYLNDFIGAKSLEIGEVIKNSGISKNYVYNILNGNKLNPGRDKVIALCIGAGMKYSEVQRGLEVAGLAVLYPKNKRDVHISVAINKGINNITELNLILEENGVTELQV